MDAASTPSTPLAEPPVPPRRRRRWRWVCVTGSLFVAALLAAPHAVALDAVRTRVETALREATGVPCQVGRLGFSWFTGFAALDVAITNPAGFAADRPALRWRRAAGNLGWLGLFGGRFEVDGEIEGLEVFVEQDPAGGTNLERLGRVEVTLGDGGEDASRGRTEPPDPSATAWSVFTRCRLDLRLREAKLEVRRDGQLLEAMHQLSCRVQKARDSEQLEFDAEAQLAPTRGDDAPGRVTARARVTVPTGTGSGMLSAASIDVARYTAFCERLWPGQLTALAGVLSGALQWQQQGDEFSVDGELTIANPQLAGPLCLGLDLRAPRWTLTPELRGKGKQVARQSFTLDLDFAQLRLTSLPSGSLANCVVELDLDALARAGELLPTALRGSGARATLACDFDPLAMPQDLETAVRTLQPTLVAELGDLTFAGVELQDLHVAGRSDAGLVTLSVDPRASLAGGALAAVLRCDLRDLAAMPSELEVRWQDGAVTAALMPVLRYALPLLAGVGADDGVQGKASLTTSLRGPGRKAPQQTWLQWLDTWSGTGDLGLRDAAFTPAPALGELLAPLGALAGGTSLGDGTQLRLDSVTVPFRFARGAVRATATEWLVRGKRLGLSGEVRLDGALDYGLDLTDLLRGHRDGERVLQALGGTLPAARLRGTVAAPSLALPDLTSTLRRIAEQQLQQRGSDLLQQGLDELLRRSRKR